VGIGYLRQLEHLLARGCQWLFDEGVLASPERRHREGVVGRNGCRDRYGVDVFVEKDVLEASGAAHARVAPRDVAQSVLTQVAEIGDFESGRLGEVPNEVWAPVADAHDADPDRRLGPSFA